VTHTPRWLRIREAAEELNISESTVRGWLLRGKLEGLKVDAVVRVDRNSIEKLARMHRYAEARKAQQRSTVSPWKRLYDRIGV